jgi:dUTP pyrophosphatase
MFLQLNIRVTDPELATLYRAAAEKHNAKLADLQDMMDSGFDLYAPEQLTLTGDFVRIDFGIQCSTNNTGYYLYPRSSLSKTPLRMANSVGIVDAGYRGNIIGAFDVKRDFVVEKHTRLVQICAPNLAPIHVNIVDEMDANTARGQGGFGSTGL